MIQSSINKSNNNLIINLIIIFVLFLPGYSWLANMSQLQCILHPPETDCPGEDVQPFDKVQWAKVQAAATRQQKLLKLSKYSGICETLPETPSASDGYRNSCYYRFTAIASETEVPATTSKDHKFLRSQSTQLEVSSSGVLPKVCIFCNKARKKVRPSG